MLKNKTAYMLWATSLSVFACTYERTTVVFVRDEAGIVGSTLRNDKEVRFELVNEISTALSTGPSGKDILVIVPPDILNQPQVDLVYDVLPSKLIQDRIRTELERAIYEAKKNASGNTSSDSSYWRTSVSMWLRNVADLETTP
ncbi:MAG TPA: hypothetical protein PK760_02425 [Flavobacteriales bacterium]|nr:hypothetical protein [Flavobacteriales bacterium]